MKNQARTNSLIPINPSLGVPVQLAETPTVEYILVQSVEQLNEVVPRLAASKVLAVDTETTSLDPLTGQIRLLQLAIANHPVIIVDFFALGQAEQEPLKQLLQGTAVKVAHTWKFDWKFLKQTGLEPQGILFDTLLASQLLAGNASGKHSLKDLCDRYLGIELDKEYQSSNWTGNLNPEQLAYAARDVAVLLPLRDVLKRHLAEAQMVQAALLEFQAIPAVAAMELNGMLLDQVQWATLATELEAERDRIGQTLHKLLKNSDSGQTSLFPEFDTLNLDSNQQVLQALRSQGIPLRRTSKWALRPLAEQYPVVQTLLEYRKVSKAISAFGTALPKHIHPVTERLHPTYWQIGAATGRFSCSDPNLQQIPRAKGMRQCFVPAPGHRLIIADYSQIELRIVAEISGDRRMTQAYQQGEDLHQLTASLVAGKSMDEVTKGERQAAKAINFGLIYAMSAMGLKRYAKSTYGVEMSDEEAETFRDRFFQAYRGVARWHEEFRRRLYGSETWTTRTLSGRLRWWREKPSLPEFLNAPVQGTSADITKQALAMLSVALKETGALLIGTVHDEILLECSEVVAEDVAHLLQATMEAAGGKFLQQVPVVAEAKITESWADK